MLSYLWLVLQTALAHALDATQTVIFLLILLLAIFAKFLPWVRTLMKWDVTSGDAALLILVAVITLRLLAAPFWIYQDQKERLADAHGRIAALLERRPYLDARITQAAYSGIPIDRPNDTGTLVILFVEITNSGQVASAAHDWSLVARANGKTYRADVYVGVNWETLTLSPRGGPDAYRLQRSSWLVDRVQPIDPGGLVDGWIVFYFPNIEREKFASEKPYVTLTFFDIFGHPTSAGMQLGINPASGIWLPGSGESIVPNEPPK